MKKFAILSSLLFVCLLVSDAAFGQKGCDFSIVGTWKSGNPDDGNPTQYRFGRDGTVTILHPTPSNQNADELTSVPRPSKPQAGASYKYKLDNPRAPKNIEFKALDGAGPVRGSMEIEKYDDDSFTTVNPGDEPTRWVRLQTLRHFLTFVARNQKPHGGPAFAMWTTLDGRKTRVEALGFYLPKGSGIFGPIPREVYGDFTSEKRSDSDVMLRLELSEAEFERTHTVYQTWDKRARTNALLYDISHLNAIKFLKTVAESLNQCTEKIELYKLDWSTSDQIAMKDEMTLPLTALEYDYIKELRRLNNSLHIRDSELR